jgi:hypothetical protein
MGTSFSFRRKGSPDKVATERQVASWGYSSCVHHELCLWLDNLSFQSPDWKILPHDVYRLLQPLQSQNTPAGLLKPQCHDRNHTMVSPDDQSIVSWAMTSGKRCYRPSLHSLGDGLAPMISSSLSTQPLVWIALPQPDPPEHPLSQANN